MSIYTRIGDDGTTSVFGGKRVLKSDLEIEAYGSLDELSSFIGLVKNKVKDAKNKELLTLIQKDVYKMMTILGNSKEKEDTRRELNQRVKQFEQLIDDVETELPKLRRFILPSGTEISCWFHILRTICRKSERSVVQLFYSNKKVTSCELQATSYLNRLSDFFFVLARKFNEIKKEVII